MDACYLGIAMGADGSGAVACSDTASADVDACSPIPAGEIDARVISLLRGRPAHLRIEGPAGAALDMALRLARLPAAEVTVLRPARARAEPVSHRAARLASEARRAA
jgi:hypothetical protein